MKLSYKHIIVNIFYIKTKNISVKRGFLLFLSNKYKKYKVPIKLFIKERGKAKAKDYKQCYMTLGAMVRLRCNRI
jgi:hypothetical protein